jgi:hypothetical protein
MAENPDPNAVGELQLTDEIRGAAGGWYLAAVVLRCPNKGGQNVSVRELWLLLNAANSESAHRKTSEIASVVSRKTDSESRADCIFAGVSELVAVEDPPSDGSELMWIPQELSIDRAADAVPAKAKLRALSHQGGPTRSGWYVGTIVLVEIHETGSHGPSLLVWSNSHLIRAEGPESAYEKAVDLGNAQSKDTGTHRCNGDTARWEFRGVGQLLEAFEPPRDGAVLWYEDAEWGPEEIEGRIPPPEELSVFRWERSRRHESGEP